MIVNRIAHSAPLAQANKTFLIANVKPSSSGLSLCTEQYNNLFEPDTFNGGDKLKHGHTNHIYDLYRTANLPEERGKAGSKAQARKALIPAINNVIEQLKSLLLCKLTPQQIASIQKAIEKLIGLKTPVIVPKAIPSDQISIKPHYPTNLPSGQDALNIGLGILGVGGLVFWSALTGWATN